MTKFFIWYMERILLSFVVISSELYQDCFPFIIHVPVCYECKLFFFRFFLVITAVSVGTWINLGRRKCTHRSAPFTGTRTLQHLVHVLLGKLGGALTLWLDVCVQLLRKMVESPRQTHLELELWDSTFARFVICNPKQEELVTRRRKGSVHHLSNNPCHCLIILSLLQVQVQLIRGIQFSLHAKFYSFSPCQNFFLLNWGLFFSSK